MRFSELDGASIGVWGLGRETRSLIHQLARRAPSARITVLADDAEAPADARELLGPAAEFVSGEAIAEALAGCDVVVRSPGVSIYTPAAQTIREAEIPMTTATSLWLAEPRDGTVIGVTGTKGKSTTSLLTAHLARAAGRTVELAGNVGRPALDLLDEPPADLYVIELSSYQTADLATGPDVAVITNLYSEHIPWHGDYATYRADKLRLAELDAVRAVVASGRDAELRERLSESTIPVRWFGEPGAYDSSDRGVSLGERLVVPAEDLPLPGAHNALNLCAALEALAAAGVTEPDLPGALDGFRPLPHRLEVLGEFGGRTWVNDSISTTPQSTMAGMASFPSAADLTLIAGGLDRGQDFSALGRELAARGALLITLPDTGRSIAAAAGDAGLEADRILEATDLAEAVALASAHSRPGALVLLSPAGASQPHFRDFEERGELLRSLVTGARAAGPGTGR